VLKLFNAVTPFFIISAVCLGLAFHDFFSMDFIPGTIEILGAEGFLKHQLFQNFKILKQQSLQDNDPPKVFLKHIVQNLDSLGWVAHYTVRPKYYKTLQLHIKMQKPLFLINYFLDQEPIGGTPVIKNSVVVGDHFKIIDTVKNVENNRDLGMLPVVWVSAPSASLNFQWLYTAIQGITRHDPAVPDFPLNKIVFYPSKHQMHLDFQGADVNLGQNITVENILHIPKILSTLKKTIGKGFFIDMDFFDKAFVTIYTSHRI